MTEHWKTDPECWKEWCKLKGFTDDKEWFKSHYQEGYEQFSEDFHIGFSAGRKSMGREVEGLRGYSVRSR